MNLFVTGGTGYPARKGSAAWLRARTDESNGVVHAASPTTRPAGPFDAAFLDVALSALAGSDRPLVYTGGIARIQHAVRKRREITGTFRTMRTRDGATPLPSRAGRLPGTR